MLHQKIRLVNDNPFLIREGKLIKPYTKYRKMKLFCPSELTDSIYLLGFYVLISFPSLIFYPIGMEIVYIQRTCNISCNYRFDSKRLDHGSIFWSYAEACRTMGHKGHMPLVNHPLNMPLVKEKKVWTRYWTFIMLISNLALDLAYALNLVLCVGSVSDS